MFLQEAFLISLHLFAAPIATAPSPNSDFDDSHLPSLHIRQEEVQAAREGQTYTPGYIHERVTLGEGSNAVSMPIVEANPNKLLEDSVQARSFVARDDCSSITANSTGCFIRYCWTNSLGVSYSEVLTITGSDGQSNPTSVESSNTANLASDTFYDNGDLGWFPQGHECSNSNTEIYTKQFWKSGIMEAAVISNLRCDTCNFDSVQCLTAPLQGNLRVAGASMQVNC
jgi:hypothetical protein